MAWVSLIYVWEGCVTDFVVFVARGLCLMEDDFCDQLNRVHSNDFNEVSNIPLYCRLFGVPLDSWSHFQSFGTSTFFIGSAIVCT